MKFWQMLTWMEPEQILEVSRFAEDLGFEGVMLGDHGVFPRDVKTPYPYSRDGKPPMAADAWYPDCWATIGAISAVTQRIRFAVAVYVLPLRNIFEVARATGTLALLSNDRFILGAGIGWMKDEFEIYGVDFHTRGRRFDEQIEVLRKLWAGGMVEHHGELIDFPPLQISPAPRNTVPIFTGGAAPVASLATSNAATRAEPSWDRSAVPPSAASEAEEREFRRLDANGDAGGTFNLGVVLHQRADVDGAAAAYKRAEERGDPDAAFNLGVLLYDAGDLDAAEAAWRRSAGRGHVRAAANLLFLSRHRRQLERGIAIQSEAPGLAEFEKLVYRRADQSGAATGTFNLGTMLHQQGDTAGALAAYERAERRGDPDAAFNLGVLLYEVGDLDGAEGAWRRSASRGHARAAENLEFLRSHRHELEAALVAGEAGGDR